MLTKKILLGVTGSIAAYKAAELIRLLRKDGYFVQVIMTKSAKEFITPLTLQALSGNPVLENMWGPDEGNGMEHINLSRTADLILIAPASANFIAKIANGLADDLLTNLCLARKCPLLIAPAMNIEMFSNSSTQRNLATIKKDGVHVSGPDHGDQACGDFGLGRLINYESLMLDIKRSTSGLLFKGKKILISTGATVEKIDDARAITNLSSGFMGLCLANAAYEFGADVTVIKGVSSHSIPSCIKSIDARNHNEMHEAITSNVRGVDIYISVAAISDYKPISNDGKIKKSNSKITLNLMPTQDILGSIGRENGNTFLVGFAAESSNLISNAKKKLKSKNLDIVIGNLISQSMGKSSAEIIIVDNEGEKILPEAPKPELSKIILRHIHKTFSKEKSYEPIS